MTADKMQFNGWTEKDIEEKLDRIEIWKDHLAGCPKSRKNWWSHAKASRVLSEDPPPEILAYDRYIDSCCYLWISTNGVSAKTPVFFRTPRQYTLKIYRKALSRLRKMMPSVTGLAIESIEDHRAVERMVNNRGHLVFHMDDAGNVVQIHDRPYSTRPKAPDASPESDSATSSSRPHLG